MKRLLDELKHAFAVEKPGPAQPTEAQQAVIERMCAEIVRRGLSMPALMFLEMSRPLNFVSAQAMHFFTPLLSAVTDAAGFEQFALFLERRGSIEYLCNCIEQRNREDKLHKDATPQAAPDHPSTTRE